MLTWFRNLRLAGKIFVSCFLFVLLIVAVSAQSYLVMQQANAHFRTLYEDNLLPMRRFNIVMKGLLQVRINMLQEEVAALHKLEGEHLAEFDRRVAMSAKIHEENAKVYAELEKSMVTPEEKKLYKDFDDSYKSMQAIGKDYRENLRSLHLEEAEVLSAKWLKVYGPAHETMTKLLELQQAQAEEAVAVQEQQTSRTTLMLAVLLIGSVVCGIFITLFLTRSISAPLQNVVKIANMLEMSDLSGTVAVDRKDETGQLGTALNASLVSLNELMGQATMTVEQVVSGTQQIASSAESLSQGATEQAGALEEITSSISELSAQTKQAAVNAESANGLAKKVMTSAGEGNERMREMVEAMEEINKASGNIAKIMKAIDEIAFQTNLLALNAAVEAARAGKYGKGFAVVAEEVRNLATRSATSAKETSEIIELSMKKIGTGSQMAGETLKSFKEIVEGINQSVRLIGEIAVSSNDQVQGIAQVEQSLQQIDLVTQQNASNAEESAAASSELAGQADLLSGMLKKFKLSASATQTAESSHSAHEGNGNGTGNGNGKAESNGARLQTKVSLHSNGNGHAPKHALAAAVSHGTVAKTTPVISLEDDDFAGL